MNWLWLLLAIGAEIGSVAALKASGGLDRLAFVGIAILAVGSSYMALGLALRSIPMGTAYAVWAGAGIAAVTLIGAVGFGQVPGPRTLVGIGCILAGIVLLFTSAAATI